MCLQKSVDIRRALAKKQSIYTQRYDEWDMQIRAARKKYLYRRRQDESTETIKKETKEKAKKDFF